MPGVLRVLPPGTDVPRTASGKVDKPALQHLLTTITAQAGRGE